MSPQLLGFSFSQWTANNTLTSIRHLNIIIAILFILGLDLTIGLIHIIAQQIQKILCLYRCYRSIC